MNVIAEENGSSQLTSLVNFIIDTSDLSAEQMTYTDTTKYQNHSLGTMWLLQTGQWSE